MQPESVSIFDQRFQLLPITRALYVRGSEEPMTGEDKIEAIKRLCDELAQARQALTLHAEIRALSKERIEEQAGTLRVLSRMITESLDAPISAGENATAASTVAGDSVCAESVPEHSPAASSARSSDRPERAIPSDNPNGPEAGEVAGSIPAAHTKFEFATGEGRTLYMNVPCSREDAETTARVLGLALGKHVIAREV